MVFVSRGDAEQSRARAHWQADQRHARARHPARRDLGQAWQAEMEGARGEPGQACSQSASQSAQTHVMGGMASPLTLQTRKRTLTRANNIARRAHELDRADRLGALRAAFRELDSLPFEEQEVVRQHWATTRFVSPEGATEVTESTVRKAAERIVVPPLVDERVGVTEGSDQGVASGQGVQTVPKPEPATYTTQTSHASHTIGLSVGRTIVRVLRSIDVLTALVARYRASNVTREWGVPESPEVSQAIEYVRELEDLTEQVEAESSTTGRAVTEAGEAHEREEGAVSARAARDFVDERIEEVMPETVAESRRQNALTMEEGEIIDAFLTPRPGPEVGEEQTQARTSPAESALPDKVLVEDDILEVWTPPTDTPLHRLDDLISRLPDVLATYDRPLNIPSQRDHADCRELLVKMGVPVIEAEPPFEAEGVASALANRGLVDYVGTEDSDVIAYDVSAARRRLGASIRSRLSVVAWFYY
jgi:flap endonuclease-1